MTIQEKFRIVWEVGGGGLITAKRLCIRSNSPAAQFVAHSSHPVVYVLQTGRVKPPRSKVVILYKSGLFGKQRPTAATVVYDANATMLKLNSIIQAMHSNSIQACARPTYVRQLVPPPRSKCTRTCPCCKAMTCQRVWKHLETRGNITCHQQRQKLMQEQQVAITKTKEVQS